MKLIRIHSQRYITQLKVQGPILSVIEVSDSVYESIISSGHKVELIEDKRKTPKINKTVFESLEIKPKHKIIEVEEEKVEEMESSLTEEVKLVEEISKPVVKTQLSAERIVNRNRRNNKRRGK